MRVPPAELDNIEWMSNGTIMSADLENSGPPKTVLAAVRYHCRLRHLSLFTEKHYVGWTKRFLRFHGNRSPWLMGECEIEQFLSHPGPSVSSDFLSPPPP